MPTTIPATNHPLDLASTRGLWTPADECTISLPGVNSIFPRGWEAGDEREKIGVARFIRHFPSYMRAQ